VVPPLPKRARVFQSSADSTIYPWARVFQSSADSTICQWARVFRFFPKQRRLQLGGSFSASQSALSSPTVNFPDAKTLFRHRSGRLNLRVSEKNRNTNLRQKKSASLKNPTTLSKDHHKKSVHPIAPQRSRHPHLPKTDNQRNSA
jgi:hypothetical protein